MFNNLPKLHHVVGMVLISCSLAFTCPAVAEPLDSRFTYQGELRQSGIPANGEFDFEFQPFDALSSGTATAPAAVIENVNVSNGVFSVELDFGLATFVGDKVWLEVGVRQGNSTGGFTGLLPRQALTAAPYALHAEMVAQNAVGSAELIDGSVGAADINTSQVQRRVSGSCSPGSSIDSISASGTVTCSAMPSPVVFKVRGQGFASQDLPGETTVEVNFWDNLVYNVGGGFNTTTKRFVAPSTGYYYLHALVDQSNSGISNAEVQISFNVGGSDYSQDVTGTTPHASVSGIYRLIAGQQVYVNMRNFTAGGGPRMDGFGSWFEGYKISD